VSILAENSKEVMQKAKSKIFVNYIKKIPKPFSGLGGILKGG